MPRDGVAFAAGLGVRTLYHIDSRPVVLEEIEIRGDKLSQRIPQIAHRGDGLEEDFREQDGGADVEISAALVEVRDHTAEEAEIEMGGTADRRAVRGRVGVRRIGTDGHVYSNWNSGAIRVQKQAGFRSPVAVATLIQHASQ